MEQCKSCVHFNGVDFCNFLKATVEPTDICSEWVPNDEVVEDEDIPLATDEGYDVASA